MRTLKQRLRRRRLTELLRRRRREISCFILLCAAAGLGWGTWQQKDLSAQKLRLQWDGLVEQVARLAGEHGISFDPDSEKTDSGGADTESEAALTASDGSADSAVRGGSTGTDAAAIPPGTVAPAAAVDFLAGVTKQLTATKPVPLSLAAPEGLEYKNCTAYDIDPALLMQEGGGVTISGAGPQVLVIHTHGSEAYTPAGEDTYEESDPYRTIDNEQNMVRVGKELCSILESRGIQTVHDETLYDYPNYNDSYTRSMAAIEKWLAEYPTIRVVLDLHRDAIEYSDGTAYKTRCTVMEEDSAQILILCGTDDSGLYHPNWRENLAFGFTLQAHMDADYPGLTRPLKVSQYRYNMQATTGSLLIEVGSHGNTLQEALTAIRCFGDALADVLLSA